MSVRPTVLLVLPRAEYLRQFMPLIAALSADPDTHTVVATSPRAHMPADGAEYHACPFYGDWSGRQSVLAWLWLVVRRERTARRLLDALRPPSVVVVPSDVADATLPFVEGARRRNVPVVYVQGAVVFPDYPALNARTYDEQQRAMSRRKRLLLGLRRRVLAACGIHAALYAKGVLGSRSDRALLMSDAQVEVHCQAGLAAERIRVTGAPFIDGLVTLRERFDAAAQQRVRRALGVNDRPVALLFTKSKFRFATVDAHRSVVSDIVHAVREELPDWACVLKLHPNEALEDYDWLTSAGDPLVRVVQEHAAEELLLLSNVALSIGSSSPAFAATILGCPILLVNFAEEPIAEPHSDLVKAAMTVSSSLELKALLRDIAESPGAIDRLRVASALDDAWADGKACERIVSQLRELTTAGP